MGKVCQFGNSDFLFAFEFCGHAHMQRILKGNLYHYL